MKSYWSNLNPNPDLIASLAESAIAESHSVEMQIVKYQGTRNAIQRHDYRFQSCVRNLVVLIPAIPASDVLRAEQLCFRLNRMAVGVGAPDVQEQAIQLLNHIRATPEYQGLLIPYEGRDAR